MSEEKNAAIWQMEIERYTDQLVRDADQLLSEDRVKKIAGLRGTSQLNLLLGVARETSSVEVVRSWVFYQMGRRETRDAWKGTGFGAGLVKQFDKMAEWANDVCQKAYQEKRPEEVQRAHITFVRLFAGYAKRWYVARGGQE
ncbi:MAG: hypothetical protein KDE59_03870 [Anaerolineales bacterium]|nr:hypothetical protein [Anaerolineales bacterium]